MNHKAAWIFVVLAGAMASTLAYGQQAPPSESTDPPGRRVFVPLEELQTLIQRDQKWVLLPRDEFNKLYAEAKKNTLDKPVPPQEIAVSRVAYAGKIVEDQLLITATFDATKFVPGWQSLVLDFRDLSLEKATVGDQAARLGRDPQAGGQLILLLDQPGKHKVTLEFSRPLIAVGSDKLAAFGLSPRWPAEFVLEVPAEKHLQWNGAAVDRPAANDQPAQYKLALGGQKSVELRVTDRPTQQSSEGLVFAGTTLGLRAAPEEVTWQAVTSLQVFGKPLDRLQFRIPEALQIISITSPGLESWEFGPNGPQNGETILDLHYRQAFQEPREITIQAVLATKTGESWQVPNLKLANVASHVTQVLITTAPGMRLQVEEAVGVQRIATEGTPQEPAAAAVRYGAWREDFLLRVTTQSKAREISAAVVTLLDINANGLDLQSRATVETKFAPLFDVSITLPAEWTVTDVLVNQKRVAWETVPQEAGLHLLRVTFETPLPVNQQALIQLTAHRDPAEWPLEEGTATIPLPEVRVLQTNVVEGTVVVAAEQDLDVQPQELKGLVPTLLDPALAARLSYEYQDTHYSGQILVLRKPSRLAVRTLAFHRLEKETFLSHLEARVTIDGGGARKLQVSMPEASGTNLRFELVSSEARIVEQTKAEPVNGRRVWTLLLDQRAHGEVLIYVDVSQPRQQAADFVPPTMQVVGAEREIGMVAFEAEPDQQLDVTAQNATGVPLPDVDPTDLTLPTGYVQKERIVAAYSYVLPGYQLKLTERRFSRVPVPTAICDRLEMVSILGETGEMQNEATFILRAVGVQSLQVVLPQNAVLWATLLDENPIEVRQTKTAYLIPLAAAIGQADVANADPSRTRVLKLFYRTAEPALGANGRITQQPPGITVLNGDGTEQPLEVLEQTWAISHPEQIEFVADPGSFIANEQYQRTSFLGTLLHSFEVDTPSNLFWKLIMLLAAGGVIAFLGYVNRQLGAQRLMASSAVILVGGLLCLLMLPAVQQAREAARRSQTKNTLKQLGLTKSDSESSQFSSEYADFLPPFAGGRTYPTAPGAAPTPAADDAVDTFNSLARVKREEAPAAEKKQAETAPAKEDSAPRSPDAYKQMMRGGAAAGRAGDMAAGGVPAPANEPLPAAKPAEEVAQAVPPPPAQQPVDERAAAPVLPPPQGNAAIEETASTSSKGVLSLALNLEAPLNSRTTSYTYRGRLNQSPPVLVVTYQNRARLSFVMLVVQITMVLICWFTRQRALALRGLILALGIGLPLGLITVVPESALPFLDGILCGTFFGVVLWMIIAVCEWLSPARLWKLLHTPVGTATMVAFALCLASGQSVLYAQDAPNAPAAPPPTPVIDADTLIIPFEDVTDPLKSNRVFLPYERFMDLWKQAHPEDPAGAVSPVAGTVAEALYAAELVPAAAGGKPRVKLTGRFVCYTLNPGQVTLPLPLGKVAVTAAQLDGESAPLVAGNDQTPLAIVISKPGLHVVDLQFSVPVQLTGPAGVFALDLAAVPAGTLQFKVPAADLNFRVNGSSGAFRRTGQAADAALIIPVSAGGQFQVSWQPKQNRGDVEAIVHVESTSAVLLAEEGTRLISHWLYQVRQGSISEAVFALPASLSVRKIEGQDVGGWELAGEGDARQLKIFLRRKVEDTTQLKFDLYLKQPADDLETTYSIPQFAPQNVTRETGTLAVMADKQFAVRVGNISGLSQIEPQQVPLQRFETEFKTSTVLAYRFATRPYELDLVVTRRQPQLKVTARHYAHIDTRKVQQQNRFHFRLAGAPRAGISLLLPQGYLLQTVNAPDVTDWHVSGREDSTDMDAEAMLHLEFATPRVGEFHVVLIGKTLRQPNQTAVEVALPYPLETDELETQLLTTFDPIYSGSAGTLDNWKSIDPAGLVRELQGDVPVANQLGFSSTSPGPAPVPFELTQAQPRLFGEALTLLTVGEESIEYLFALQWKISKAGADTFVFTTPDWLADKLDFPDANGPRRRGVTREAVDGGRTRWTISLEDPQRVGYFIVARAVLPASAKGEITAPNIIFEQLQPGQDPPLYSPVSQSQFLVLVNQSQTQLTSTAPELVQAIPAEDLLRSIKLRQDLIDQAAEIVQVLSPQTQMTWRQQRFKAEQQLPAAVNLAHHVTVLAADGSWREQVTYRLKNRKRQFLAVKLPADSQVLSLFVKGVPSRPVLPGNGSPFTLIPLPKTVEGDVSFDVQLVLAGQLPTGPLPRRWALLPTAVDVPIPEVVSPEENREYGIPVSQTTWTVYVPRYLNVDVLKRSAATNVTAVSELGQALDQAKSELADVTDLISVNLGNGNRRAKAQSLTNLKHLNSKLQQLNSIDGPVGNLEEVTKQQELKQRAGQLQQKLDQLFVTNSAEGLIFQEDAAGNTVVIDQKVGQSDQNERLQQLYLDNSVSNNIAPDQTTVLGVPPMGSDKPVTANEAKGNLNRENLRGFNYSQVQELAGEQRKKGGKSSGDQLNAPQAATKFRAYAFQQQPNTAQGLGGAQTQNTTQSISGSQPGVGGPPAMNPLSGMVRSRGALNGILMGAASERGAFGFDPQGNQQAAGQQGVNGIVAPPVWTTSGGLSLMIDIPKDGRVLNFSKVSGGARLGLGIRPHQTWQRALGFVWAAIWGVILVLVAAAFTRRSAQALLWRKAPWFIAALGIAIFFLMAGGSGVEFWGLFAFIGGALWIAFRKPVPAAA